MVMTFSVATISNNQTIPHGALPSRIQDPHRWLEHHRSCSAQFTKSVVSSHPPALQHRLHQMHRQWVLCIQTMSLAKRLIFCLVRCISCFHPFLFTLQQHCLLLWRVAVWPRFSHTVTHLATAIHRFGNTLNEYCWSHNRSQTPDFSNKIFPLFWHLGILPWF